MKDPYVQIGFFFCLSSWREPEQRSYFFFWRGTLNFDARILILMQSCNREDKYKPEHEKRLEAKTEKTRKAC